MLYISLAVIHWQHICGIAAVHYL